MGMTGEHDGQEPVSPLPGDARREPDDEASFDEQSEFEDESDLDDSFLREVASVPPRAQFRTLLPGERILLCSDGLNEVLSDADIAALLTGHAGEALLNACKVSRRAGGTDDFTVILLEGASSADING